MTTTATHRKRDAADRQRLRDTILLFEARRDLEIALGAVAARPLDDDALEDLREAIETVSSTQFKRSWGRLAPKPRTLTALRLVQSSRVEVA